MAGKAAFEMKVTGVESLLGTFRNYFNDIDSSTVLLQAMSAIGKTVEAKAKDILNEKIYNTPERGYIRTGFLRARTTSDAAVNQNGNMTVIVRSRQKYAPYIEFGTKNMKPRAFLLPAAQEKSNDALQILSKALDKFLRGKIVK